LTFNKFAVAGAGTGQKHRGPFLSSAANSKQTGELLDAESVEAKQRRRCHDGVNGQNS